MVRITLTQNELENMVEKALENACAYHATGNYKLMYQYRATAEAYLDLLEDNGIMYDDVTINEHVEEMRSILAAESRKLKIERI